jgi:hypothetical protein
MDRDVPFRIACFALGGAQMAVVLLDSERAARIKAERAARYRERAEHLKGMAQAETRPCERAQVLELAESYERVADDLVGKTKP